MMGMDGCAEALAMFREHESFLKRQLTGQQRHRGGQATALLKALDIVSVMMLYFKLHL